MNVTIRTAIGLIKSAITGQPENVQKRQCRDAAQLMVHHGILNVAYVGLLNNNIPKEAPAMQVLLDQYCMGLIHSEQQLSELRRICEALEENGFDHMPVKGALLKHMYPSHELRPMSDADILIREEEYSGIRTVMQNLGYEEVGESDHEHIWTNPLLKVELHKRLIPSYNKDYYSYFGEGWDLAKVQNGHRWAMTQEDAFLYNFIHFAKHYRDSDVDCRFVIDIWVHLRHCPDMDMVYIRKQMERMQMLTFFENIMRVVDAWFNEGYWDARTERITEVLFRQDAQEREESRRTALNARQVQQDGSVQRAKLHMIRRSIFPSRQVMNWSYPQFRKLPLPVAWVVRWGSLLVHGAKRRRKMGGISEKKIEHYRQDLEYVGLQFSDNVALPD